MFNEQQHTVLPELTFYSCCKLLPGLLQRILTGPQQYKKPETHVLTQWETVILLDGTSREAVNQVGLVHYIRELSLEAITRGYLPPFLPSSQYNVLSFLQYMKKRCRTGGLS